jgi:tRNA G18 (ribose-2'-O)-methylase SpoU
MGLRVTRRRIEKERLSAIRRYEKQKRDNLVATCGLHKFIIVLDHLKPAINVGKIFRSADAFGAREVHLIGTSFFDPSPAKGSFKYVPARFYDDFRSCHEALAQHNYALFTLQPDTGDLLSTIELPAESAFIFGNEEFVLSFRVEDYGAIKPLKIPQYGRVQSLNVSIAASIVMYEYVKQHGSVPA